MDRLQAPLPVRTQAVAGPLGAGLPVETQVVRVVLATEAVSLAMGGLGAAVLALMAMASGREWYLYAVAAGGMALAMIEGAVALGLLRRQLSRALDRWKLGVLVVEAAAMPIGWWAMSIEAAYHAQNPGDHGPWADGSDAVISVLGFLFSFGAALIILSLLEERVRFLRASRANGGGS